MPPRVDRFRRRGGEAAEGDERLPRGDRRRGGEADEEENFEEQEQPFVEPRQPQINFRNLDSYKFDILKTFDFDGGIEKTENVICFISDSVTKSEALS